jgi:hypothetical protein
MNTVIDICEVATSCAYAAWLDTHKGLEPKMTWAEVVFGVAYTLTFSTLRGALHGGSWWDQTKRIGRDFALSGTPIIINELRQAIEARRTDAEFDEEHPT